MAQKRTVIITGGFGFLGQELCKVLLKGGTLGGNEIGKVVLVDVVDLQPRPSFCSDSRVEAHVGNPADMKFCEGLMANREGALSLYHLGGIMSGQGEQDFDLCLASNLDATRNLLQAARKSREGCDQKACVVFSSAGACFGETDERPVSDTTKLVPLNTYGMTKACCELLLNDFARKGFIDGRAGRLPTVVVRPGKPNAATTSCFSGVVREPLHGVDCEVPVGRHLPHCVTSTRAIIGGLITLHDVKWPDNLVDRAVNFPSIPTTLQELIDGMHRVVAEADHGKLGKIVDRIDPFLNKVVSGMAVASMCAQRAETMGLPRPGNVDQIIREFLEDFGDKAVVHAAPPASPAKRPRTQL